MDRCVHSYRCGALVRYFAAHTNNTHTYIHHVHIHTHTHTHTHTFDYLKVTYIVHMHADTHVQSSEYRIPDSMEGIWTKDCPTYTSYQNHMASRIYHHLLKVNLQSINRMQVFFPVAMYL